MAQNDPWAEFRVQRPAPAPSMGDPVIAPADPYKQAEQSRANQSQANQNLNTSVNVRDTAHDNAITDSKVRIDNPQSLRTEYAKLPEVQAYKVSVQQLSQALGTGEGPQADLALTYAFAKAMDPDSVVRDSEQNMVIESQPWFRAKVEEVKKQFGMDGAGTFTPEARAALRQQIIRSVISRDKIYEAKRAFYSDLARRNGIDPFEVIGTHDGEAYREQARQYDASRRAAGANVAPVSGSQPEGNGGVTPPVIGGDAPAQMQAAQGDGRRVDDPALTAQLDQMMRKGASLNAINSLLQSRGASLVSESDYQKVKDFLQQHPDYRGSVAQAWRMEPISGFERAVTDLGNNPVGAYTLHTGQFLSGNTLDNLASDPERARASMGVITSQNPNASAMGDVSGGIMGAMLGEAALARMGIAGGATRSLAADTFMGTANGAGSADGPGQSRGLNALAGGATAFAGSAGGNLITKGVSNALAPSGGAMADLYGAGVRPTPGQRFSNSGVVGNALNRTEEAMQSLPIVGPAISGARQEARDQFQIGAFNEALKEVGEQLPKGMKPGTAPQGYAQATFKRVYAEARKGMRLVVDEELSNDVAGMADNINSLGPQDLARFKSIVENRVNNKLRSGEAGGEAYKRIISGLEDQIGKLKSNPQAQELMGVITDLKFAIENAARRHSDPEAVALLDAADAGYAKFVRIEDAAARRGGDAGTFTPAQFDRAVQKEEGGVRSKPYLRGDALMQDYADQGKGLVDRLPNSGTADRLGFAKLGLGLLLTPVTLAYAPGTRKVMQEALAPAGVKRAAISAQLKKRAALVGRAGAATGAALLPGTSPGQ